MSEFEDRLAHCDRHIADLTDRIASVKENFQGTGLITASEFVGLFERTLESWIEMKKKLLGSSDGSDGV